MTAMELTPDQLRYIAHYTHTIEDVIAKDVDEIIRRSVFRFQFVRRYRRIREQFRTHVIEMRHRAQTDKLSEPVTPAFVEEMIRQRLQIQQAALARLALHFRSAWRDEIDAACGD